ncbi:MAG: hypothetical protein Q9163_001147, partial [Psora crenata]
MSRAYIHSKCSPRVFYFAQQRLRQASFVSLGKATGQDNHSGLSPPRVNVEDGETPNLRQTSGQRSPNGIGPSQKQQTLKDVDQTLESLFASNQVHPPARSRYSRKPSALTGDRKALSSEMSVGRMSELESRPLIGAPAIALNPPPASRYSRRPIEQAEHLEAKLSNIAEQLLDLQRQLDDESASLEEIWHCCDKIIESPLWKENVRSRILQREDIFSVFQTILREVTRRRSIEVNAMSLSPVNILAAYRRNGAIKFWWHEVLWIQLGNVLRLRAERDLEGPGDAQIIKFGALLQDILQVWMMFMQVHHQPREVEQRTTWNDSANNVLHFPSSPLVTPEAPKKLEGWQALSYMAKDGEAQPALPQQLSLRFQYLLGNATRTRKMSNVAAAAILTLHYLKVFNTVDPSRGRLLAHAEPFMRFLDRVAENVHWDCPGFEFCLQNVAVPSKAIHAARGEWACSPVNAVKSSPSVRKLSGTSMEKTPSIWDGKNIERLLSDLNHIKDSSDAAEAAKLWRRTQPTLNSRGLKDEKVRSNIFARFLTTLFAVRQQDEAVDVWNHMVNTGHKPGLNHWNAMMHGCNSIKDISSLEGIWVRMRESKVQSDNELWTTYIHGVIKAGKWQQGLQLLEQLGREWKTNTLVPSLGPIHGALSGLLQIDKRGMLPTIVAWARSQGLRPTVHTYNILLRPLARSGTPQEIQALLETMAKDDCQPDIFTYTMILNGLVHFEHSPFHTLSQKEQDESINTLLTEMQANNINPTPHTYTTILDGLLDSKYHEPNIPAARKVISRMHTAGIHPPPHIHVILLTYYFSLSPPDLHAIDSLLHTLLHNPSTAPKNLDHVFYDRLISNFANIGEPEKALTFLKRMVAE